MKLLAEQSPLLATEEVWAHATPAPERGGLLIAAPDAASVLGSERYWCARECGVTCGCVACGLGAGNGWPGPAAPPVPCSTYRLVMTVSALSPSLLP